MTSYLDGIEDKSFEELKSDGAFRRDLVSFFEGGRYTYTRERMKEEGYEGLTKKFVEHMRFQEWNDATALKDLNYVINKKADPAGKVAFGRLIQAWDGSKEVGTGYIDGAADFTEALIKSPSTYLGFGVGKLAAKGSTKVVQMAVRHKIKNYLKSKAILKGAASGAAVDGVVGGGQSYGMGETREELSEQGNFIDGYEYTKGDLFKDVAINSTIGAATGALGGAWANKISVDKAELSGVMEKSVAAAKEKAKQEATDTIKKAKRLKNGDAIIAEALNRTIMIVDTLAARRGKLNTLTPTANKLDPLDPQKVAMGEAIKKGVLDTTVEDGGAFSSGLDITTIRSIAAATIEMSKKFKVNPGERITSAIAGAIRDPNSTAFDALDEIREKFNLTKEQMSLIYLADVSQAGKILAEQSAIVRKGNKTVAAKTERTLAEADLENQLFDLKKLSQRGLSSIDDLEAADISANVIRNSSKRGAIEISYNFLQDLDQMRIAFMTSQTATTARNVTSTGLLGVVDIMDESFRTLFYGEKGSYKNIYSTMKGMTWGKAEASLMKDILRTEMPEAYQRTFHDTMRMEVGTKSNSNFAKVGRLFNLLNTVTDTAFKEAALYSSLDRQLRRLNNKTLGVDVKDFITTTGSLDKLPEGMLDRALDDANRFTMQRTYLKDPSLFGKGARAASKLNENFPFIMSGLMGIPFPRYVANHIEMVADYTPFLPEFIRKLDDQTINKKGMFATGDPYKSLEDRRVRQFTGASLIIAGMALASSKKGEIDYKSLENEIKGQDDISSSLGFLIAPIFIGDTFYRAYNKLPWSETVLRDSSEILAGLGDMGFDLAGVKALYDMVVDGDMKAKDKLAKTAGNIFSVFTYPTTPARDLMGQVNYDSSGVPYTRPLGMGEEDDPSTPDIDESVSDSQRPEGIFVSQLTRFLPDVAFTQYSQARGSNPDYDYEYYSILNKQPVATMNPLQKTFTGVAASPTLTQLGREFNKMKIEERDVYDNSKNVNPVIDYVVRRDLSQNLSPLFEQWAENNVFKDGVEAGKTYNQLTDSVEKRAKLMTFVTTVITDTNTKYNEGLTALMSTNPVKARGYIRNMYMLKLNQIGVKKMDFAVKHMFEKGMIDKDYASAQELLSSAETIDEEMQIRLKLLFVANSSRIKTSTEDLPD
tara:strand:+ start:118 stop:3597 length:3480 start_codon:yes stop_codon:yes gene_type:complete